MPNDPKTTMLVNRFGESLHARPTIAGDPVVTIQMTVLNRSILQHTPAAITVETVFSPEEFEAWSKRVFPRKGTDGHYWLGPVGHTAGEITK